nr:hypothetical protein [Candidatus Sigynarchaeum springense]
MPASRRVLFSVYSIDLKKALLMNPIATLGRLLFSPAEIITSTSPRDAKLVIAIGTVAGMAGLGINVGWLIPDDVIGLGYKLEQALLVNKALGVAIGILLVVVLALFDRLLLACFKIKGKPAVEAVHGSLAIFLLVPFAAIPLHSFFPAGVTASGHVELFWILAGLFVIWHVCVLGSIL